MNTRVGLAVSLAYDEGGMLGVQVDTSSKSNGGHGRYVVGSFGIIGRPKPANDEGGSLTLFGDEGKEGFAWCGFDNRDLEKAPPLTDGSVALYNSDGAYHLLDAVAQTATLYIPADEGAHMMTVGKTASGKHIFELLHSNGSRFTLGETETVWRGTGDGFIMIKGSNITANGTFKAGSADFGGGAGVPLATAAGLIAAINSLAAPFAGGGGSPATCAQIATLLTGLAAALGGPAATTKLTAI
jgi:hypothetical protein